MSRPKKPDNSAMKMLKLFSEETKRAVAEAKVLRARAIKIEQASAKAVLKAVLAITKESKKQKLPVSQYDIAKLIGICRQRVSQILAG